MYNKCNNIHKVVGLSIKLEHIHFDGKTYTAYEIKIRHSTWCIISEYIIRRLFSLINVQQIANPGQEEHKRGRFA